MVTLDRCQRIFFLPLIEVEELDEDDGEPDRMSSVTEGTGDTLVGTAERPALRDPNEIS